MLFHELICSLQSFHILSAWGMHSNETAPGQGRLLWGRLPLETSHRPLWGEPALFDDLHPVAVELLSVELGLKLKRKTWQHSLNETYLDFCWHCGLSSLLKPPNHLVLVTSALSLHQTRGRQRCGCGVGRLFQQVKQKLTKAVFRHEL